MRINEYVAQLSDEEQRTLLGSLRAAVDAGQAVGRLFERDPELTEVCAALDAALTTLQAVRERLPADEGS